MVGQKEGQIGRMNEERNGRADEILFEAKNLFPFFILFRIYGGTERWMDDYIA